MHSTFITIGRAACLCMNRVQVANFNCTNFLISQAPIAIALVGIRNQVIITHVFLIGVVFSNVATSWEEAIRHLCDHHSSEALVNVFLTACRDLVGHRAEVNDSAQLSVEVSEWTAMSLVGHCLKSFDRTARE